MPITHTKVNPKSDSSDTTIVRPSDWNAAHTGGYSHDHSSANDGKTLRPALLLPQGGMPGRNLVHNGSFESGFQGWNNAGAYLAGGAPGNVPDGIYEAGFAFGAGYKYLTQSLPALLAGHWYTASFRMGIAGAATSSAGAGILISEGLSDAVSGSITTNFGSVAGTFPACLETGTLTGTEFRWVTGSRIPPRPTNMSCLPILTVGHGVADIYFDAVQVNEGGSPTNYQSDGVPSGTIVLWYGTIASIPYGWVLCGGTNGTPAMGQRVVIPATGATSAPLTVGGSQNLDTALPTHATHTTHPGQTTGTNSTQQVLVEGSGTLTTVAAIGHTHSTPALSHSAHDAACDSVPHLSRLHYETLMAIAIVKR